jgi:predicted metalloprotease with PDZ domain
MKYFFSLLLTASWMLNLSAQAFEPIQRADEYRVWLDLTAVSADQLPVQMVTPICMEDSVEFHMPRVIPGTYDVNNYGSFISNFKALAADGTALKHRKLDKNRWRIYGAKQLYKITYLTDDTYDAVEDNDIFEPSGTSLKKDTVYLLNNFGFVGYIAGKKDFAFEVNVKKPKGFYGATALIPAQQSAGETKQLDQFVARNYFELHDNPMLYCMPDTASMQVGNARVLVSMYSPLGLVSADTALENIAEVLQAAANYLGGELPVEKYAVLIYCEDPKNMGMSYGALEHHQSTVLYMPESGKSSFYKGVVDITSHEFFHIITPLSIHSEHISDFDFINPKMSKHIWLYEGITEYNSILVQVRDGLISPEEFLDELSDKMSSADEYNPDVPLTLASEFTLTFLKDQYLNFYQKGALAGLALDLKLRALSEGSYGLPDLLKELGATYGADTFFVDEDLFDIITELTYPEMREFFALHFEGTVPFDFNQLLRRAGVIYIAESPFERLSYGNIGFGYNFETGRLVVEDVSEMDAFGEDLGFEQGDEIIEFNEQPIDILTINEVMTNFFTQVKVGKKVKVLVARPQEEEGVYKEKTLKARTILTTQIEEHVLRFDEKPEPQMLRMRKAWINQ